MGAVSLDSLSDMAELSPIMHFFYMTKRCPDENLCLTTHIPFKVNSAVIEPEFYENDFVQNYKNIVFNSNVPSYSMDVVISDSPEAAYDYNGIGYFTTGRIKIDFPK